MKPWIRILILSAAAVLGGCASQTPRVAPAQQLFHDQLFQPPSAPIDTASVFALTPEMRDYVNAYMRNVPKKQ